MNTEQDAIFGPSQSVWATSLPTGS